MLNDLYDTIAERIEGLGRFKEVSPALASEPPGLPAVEIWLAKETGVTDTPGVLRDVVHACQITVGNNDTKGAAQREMNDHIDAIRDAFAGWRPDTCQGILGEVSLPEIKIDSYRDHGSAVYVLAIQMRVNPGRVAKL